jgi:hypothetical protein
VAVVSCTLSTIAERRELRVCTHPPKEQLSVYDFNGQRKHDSYNISHHIAWPCSLSFNPK